MSTIKLGWGGRIALLYGGFVLLMAVLITGSLKQDFDLVSKDYYQDELQYQDILDAGRNQALLSTPVKIQAGKNDIAIEFPGEFSGLVLNGTIHFYCQVNSSRDRIFPLEVSNNRMVISRNMLSNMDYMVKIKWTAASRQYYQQTEIDLR